jgi:hypothetical protein
VEKAVEKSCFLVENSVEKFWRGTVWETASEDRHGYDAPAQ